MQTTFFGKLPIGAFFTPLDEPWEYLKLDKKSADGGLNEPVSDVESLYTPFDAYEPVKFLGMHFAYEEDD